MAVPCAETMEAIGATIVAKLSKADAEELFQHAKKLDPAASRPKVELFAKFSMDDIPDAGNTLLDYLSKSLHNDKAFLIRAVLAVLGTSLGTRLVCGNGFKKFAPFCQLDSKDRELALKRLSSSMFADLRILCRTFHTLVALLCFGESWTILEDAKSDNSKAPYNALWQAIDYKGPEPEKPRATREQVWTPTFLNVEEASMRQSNGTLLLSYDVVVIGSGCGGGVVASQLSAAGYSVLILDKASYTHTSEYSLTEMKSFESFYERGALLGTEDGAIQIVAGTSWGGGSTVNWSASLELPQVARKEWAEKFGLPYFSSAEYQKDINAVQKRLGISTDHLTHNVPNQKLLDGCEKLGIKAEKIPQNTGGHEHSCGYCTYGCPYGEKQSSLLTWIKDASRDGCHLIQSAVALKIHHSNGVVKGVRVRVDDTHNLYVKAKRVVVSCGAINSPPLLLRSEIDNPNIGKNLRLHPVVTVGAVFKEKTAPHNGSIMTVISNHHANSRGDGYGCRYEVAASHPSLFSVVGGWTGSLQAKKNLLSFPHSSNVIVLTRDKDSVGSVKLDREGNAQVEFQIGSEDAKSMTESLVDGIRILLAAGAVRVSTAQNGSLVFECTHDSYEKTIESSEFKDYLKAVRNAGVVQTKALCFSAHQMGTNRMGPDSKTSVVKPTGESWDVKGLYIADSSVFPTASGVK